MRNLKLGRDVILQQPLGRIGDDVVIGDCCEIKTGATFTSGTVLGSNVFVGPYAVFLGDGYDDGKKAGARIGDRVRIGAHTLIAPGITIAADVHIGALSFVRKSITEAGTYAGIPARKIRDAAAQWPAVVAGCLA